MPLELTNHVEPDELLRHFEVPSRPGIFTLGWRARRITVYDQQVRALNLVDALVKTGRLKSEDYVAVIGAGFGGLTAAAAAASVGARVRVIDDRPQPLDLQRGCDHRWLHPHVYDWPAQGSGNPHADVLFLDWQAAKASEVVDSIEAKWKALVRRGAIQESFLTLVHDFRSSGDGWMLETEPKTEAFQHEVCKVVVLAIGFGIEGQKGMRRMLRYWDRDNLHRFPIEARGTIRYLVVGTGDGALIDTLRAKLKDFRHDRVLEDFKLIGREMQETRERLTEIEKSARGRSDADDFLKLEYQRLRGTDEVDNALRRRAHEQVQVVLATRAPHFYSLKSTALNRFLVSRLVALGLVEHRQGDLVEVNGGSPARVRLAGSPDELEFYDVITRIGPESALARHLPSIEALCAKVPHLGDLDPTRVPLNWSSLRSRPLPPLPVGSLGPRETTAYYATSRKMALFITNPREAPSDPDAENSTPYLFFLDYKQARHYAASMYGVEEAEVLQALVQELPPNLYIDSIRPTGSDGQLPTRFAHSGREIIVVGTFKYVTFLGPATRIEGDEK